MKRLILFVVFLSFNLTANSILIKSGQIHDGQGNSFIGDILITDNKIVVVGLESMFENMIRDKVSEKGTAFIAHNWIFDKDTPGKVIIGKSIKIDRTSGNGSILQIVMDTITTSPINSCSTSKPKLLF